METYKRPPHAQLHHEGVVRLKEQPDGRASIEIVRIVNRAIEKKNLDLTKQEVAALDAAFRESCGRTETPGVQLVLDLPRRQSEPGPAIPLPRAPRHVKPRRYWFPRHKGARRGSDA